jgi:hypothetical protein
MELLSIFKTGSEAISLVSALAKLMKLKESTTIDEPPSSLSEILQSLHINAIRLSRDLENTLRNLLNQIQEFDLNPSKNIEQQLKELSWYNFSTRSRLKSVRDECQTIYQQLTNFVDDATSILICNNQQQKASDAFERALYIKRDLDYLFSDKSRSLHELIDGMLATASRVSSELQKA